MKPFALSVCRLQAGFDDSCVPRSFEQLGFECINIDDRCWSWHAAPGRTARAARRLLRASTAQDFNRFIRTQVTGLHLQQVFIFKAPDITADTIRALQSEHGAHVTVFYPDLAPWRESPGYLEACRAADVYLHTKPQCEALHRQRVRPDARVTPPFWDPAERVEPRVRAWRHDISFIGHYSAGKCQTLAALARLTSRQIHVFGAGWEGRLPAAVQCHGPVYGPAARQIAADSRVTLGLLQEALPGESSPDVITSRSVRLPIWGAACLHPANAQAAALYEGAHGLFGDVEALAQQMERHWHDDEHWVQLCRVQQAAVMRQAPSIGDLLQGLRR